MWAKPTERVWWRKLTVGEWVGLVSAVGSLLSAFFAMKAADYAKDQVKAANDQVRVAIDAVDRTEKLKALSEFSTAARTFCASLVPPDFKSRIQVNPQFPEIPELSGDRYRIPQIDNIDDQEKAKTYIKDFKNKTDVYLDLSRKSQILSFWFKKGNEKNMLIGLIDYIPSVVDILEDEKEPLHARIGRAFSGCEKWMERSIEIFIKQ